MIKLIKLIDEFLIEEGYRKLYLRPLVLIPLTYKLHSSGDLIFLVDRWGCAIHISVYTNNSIIIHFPTMSKNDQDYIIIDFTEPNSIEKLRKAVR